MESNRLQVVIEAETSRLQRGVRDAREEVQDFARRAQQEMSKVDDAIKEAGAALTDFGKKAGTAMAAAGAALVGTAAATEEYRQNQAQLNAAFEQAGFSAASAEGAYRELYKTIGDDDQAVESAANIAMLADSEKEAAKWAELASGVLGTFHDTLQPEAFYEAANETLKLGEATGAFTQMLEQTGVMSVDEFNKKLAECTTEAEKQAFMLEVSEKAMGEAGKSYDESTAKIQAQREAQTKLMGVLAKVGDAMAPVLTAFTTFAAEALQPLADKIKPLAEEYAPKLSEALGAAGEAVGKAFGFFTENWGVIVAIAGVIGGIAAAIGLYNTVAAVKAAMDAAQVTTLGALVAAQWAHVTATLAALAPYLLIVAAIAAVIAIIVLCVKNWDTIKEKVAEVAAAIKEKVSEMVEKVKEFFANMAAAISERVEAIKAAVREKFEAIKSAITEKVNAAKNTVSNVFNGIKSAISSAVNAAKSTVSSVFDGIKNAIKSKIDAARDAVKSAIEKIKGFFNFSWELPKIKMPHFSISGSFSLNPPSIPKFSVSWYKMGGVFDSPTLFPYGNGQIGGLGEAGAEAIVPLEKNTEWLDKIAERLSGGMGGGTIIMQVDGSTFAKVAVKSINDLTKQQGSLPLRLV